MLVSVFAVNLYVLCRIAKAVEFFVKKFPKWITYLCSALSALVIVLGFIRSMIFDSVALKVFIGAVFSCWAGVFIYLFIFILLSDIAYLFVLMITRLKDKRKVIRAVAVIVAVVLAVSVSVYGFYNATVIKEKSYQVSLDNKEIGDMKVVLVSDLHLGAQKSEQRLSLLVDTINSKSADIVCICGDLFDNDYYAIKDPDKAIAQLSRIKATHGVYVVFGNHDAGKTESLMKDFVSQCGFTLLEEEYKVVDNKITLVGRADSSPIGESQSARMETKVLFNNIPDDLPVVVMDHNPLNASEYGSLADLVLSGHTHKGQIFPGSLITSAMYDVDYGYGVIDNGPQVIVTSGFGTWGMPMRVGTDSEVVTINID